MNAYTPHDRATELPGQAPSALTDVAREARQADLIATICAHELTGPHWSEDARCDLREIRSAACGVIDHEAGHEGFEGAQAELERRVSEWAENVDYRTFPRLTDEQLVALSVNQRKFGRENRRAGGR